jgi:undecaprenyl-diphosphatase
MHGAERFKGEGTETSSKSRLRLSIGRRPYDVLRVLVLGGLLALCALVALLPANPIEVAIFEQLRAVPASSDPVWTVLTWFGSWLGIAAVAVFALYFKWVRLGLLCAVAGGGSWGVARTLDWLLRPRLLPPMPGVPPGAVFHFPSAAVAVMAALAVVTKPYLPGRVRHIGYVLTLLVAVADVHLGQHLPLGALGGALLGGAVGGVVHVIGGVPGRKVSEEVMRRELGLAGFEPVSVVPLQYRMFEPREFAVRTVDREVLRVKVVRRMRRRAGMWHRLGRLLTLMEVPDDPRLSTPHHEVEHEAYVALLAERAGVRTPPVLLAAGIKHAPPILVRRQIEGRRLSQIPVREIGDDLLRAIWGQVSALAAAGIAHHDLRAKNFLVDARGRPWLLSFTFGNAGAGAERRAQDLAEAMVSLAAVVGVDRTVETAIEVLTPEQLAAALKNLHPFALPRRIRQQTDIGRYLLAALRETLADRTGHPIPGFRSPVSTTTVVGLLMIGAAVYLLLPELSSMQEVLEALRGANWWWLGAAVVTGFGGIFFSAVSVVGSSRVRLPFWPTTAVQIAAAFTGRTTPGGVGFFGINLAFMERLGLRRSLAVGITVLNQAATGFVAFVVGVVGLFGAGMTGALGNLSIPTGWPVLLGVVGGLFAVGLVLGSPYGRRRLVRPVLDVARELLETLRYPVRAVQLCGGALGYLVVSGLGVGACLAAITPNFSWVAVVTVFVVANTVGHLAPAPGGLGAVEAVMIAGLDAVGIAPTAAVTAVLTSRLLTYWVPVLPGIAMFRYLQHRKVI